jgi:hypothetical protein
LHLYGRSPFWGVALPAVAAWYVALTVDSAIQHARGRGGEWKGRVWRKSSAEPASQATHHSANPGCK